MVVFPLPLAPIIAIFSPAFISNETSFKVGLSSLYEKSKFLILISIYLTSFSKSLVTFFSQYKSNILFILFIAAFALAYAYWIVKIS